MPARLWRPARWRTSSTATPIPTPRRSLPTVDSDRTERLVSIAGTPPDLLNPPKGCAFAARCKHCMKICQEEQPPEFTVGEGHVASCWLLHPDCPSAEERGEKIVD